MREAIEQFCGIPVVGAIPKDANLVIPDRHLGLVTNGEMEDQEDLLNYLADIICNHVDLDKIMALAGNVPDIDIPAQANYSELGENVSRLNGFSPRIGVIQDKAFSFYYPENIEALQSLG